MNTNSQLHYEQNINLPAISEASSFLVLPKVKAKVSLSDIHVGCQESNTFSSGLYSMIGKWQESVGAPIIITAYIRNIAWPLACEITAL